MVPIMFDEEGVELAVLSRLVLWRKSTGLSALDLLLHVRRQVNDEPDRQRFDVSTAELEAALSALHDKKMIEPRQDNPAWWAPTEFGHLYLAWWLAMTQGSAGDLPEPALYKQVYDVIGVAPLGCSLETLNERLEARPEWQIRLALMAMELHGQLEVEPQICLMPYGVVKIAAIYRLRYSERLRRAESDQP